MFASDELIEAMAQIVERSPDYRVARRLKPHAPRDLPDADLTVIILDVETTGLDPDQDEIIELSMLKSSCTMEGEIARVDAIYSGTREATKPIPPQITALTGISNQDVVGTSIDRAFVAEFIAGADLIVAHNAAYDRVFCERLFPEFSQVPWGCSVSQIPWPDPIKRLDALLAHRGLFHDAHRGLSDCYAVLFLLTCDLDGKPALAHVFENAHRATSRLFAVGAPFASRHILKGRGYKWDPRRRSWYLDLDPAALDYEVAFLQTVGFTPEWRPQIATIDAFSRFSERV